MSGDVYTSDVYSYKITTNAANPRGAEELVRHYPVGSVVDVHYDPKKPKNAVLLPGVNKWSYMGFPIAIIFLIMSAAIFNQS